MSPAEKYLSLETYRKDGQPVLTPVWFATAPDGTIYIYSVEDAFKVKRARNNPHGRIAACSVRGVVHGEWEPVLLRIVTEAAEYNAAQKLLDEKYGWIKKLGNLFSKLRPKGRTAIAITANPQA